MLINKKSKDQKIITPTEDSKFIYTGNKTPKPEPEHLIVNELIDTDSSLSYMPYMSAEGDLFIPGTIENKVYYMMVEKNILKTMIRMLLPEIINEDMAPHDHHHDDYDFPHTHDEDGNIIPIKSEDNVPGEVVELDPETERIIREAAEAVVPKEENN